MTLFGAQAIEPVARAENDRSEIPKLAIDSAVPLPRKCRFDSGDRRLEHAIRALDH
jgi:hypothetical protein